jgi:predicted RNA binding protein YcfA (HicA-like mRNA interferase family)
VANRDKNRDAVLGGKSGANVRFADLCGLLRRLGFDERIKGSHHIFARHDVAEILNLQPRRGKAKPYQVKQVRTVILKYGLAGDKE